MKIVALCGFIGAGKSTIARHLIDKHGFRRVSFAEPVKDAAAVIFGWDRQKLDGATPEDRIWREAPDPYWSVVFKEPNFSPRVGLQRIGDGARKFINPDIWVSIGAKKIKAMPYDSRLVFDDVRYVNERRTLRDLGAHMFAVHRGNDRGIVFPTDEHRILWDQATHDRVLALDAENIKLHISEWDWLRDVTVADDGIILNKGTEDDLRKFIDELVQFV